MGVYRGEFGEFMYRNLRVGGFKRLESANRELTRRNIAGYVQDEANKIHSAVGIGTAGSINNSLEHVSAMRG